MAHYQWKKDAPTPKVAAQVFGDMVEKIAGDVSSAKPDDIVAAARPRKSPIHAMFEWRDDHAAEAYRRQQARGFIGSLQIVRVEFSEGQTLSSRAFFSVSTEKRTGYVGQDRILGNRDLQKQVFESARQELESYLRKYASILALGTFVPRLQEIIDDMRDNADALLADASRLKRKPKSNDVEETTLAP